MTFRRRLFTFTRPRCLCYTVPPLPRPTSMVTSHWCPVCWWIWRSGHTQSWKARQANGGWISKCFHFPLLTNLASITLEKAWTLSQGSSALTGDDAVDPNAFRRSMDSLGVARLRNGLRCQITRPGRDQNTGGLRPAGRNHETPARRASTPLTAVESMAISGNGRVTPAYCP